MGKVWCNAITAAAKGKTAGTYDSLGTITVKKGASDIIGIIANVATPKPTDGISGMPILQISAPDCGVSEQKFVLGKSGIGDGIATNNKERYCKTEFIPFTTISGSVSKSKFTFKLSSTSNITEGWDACIGLVFADFKPDAEFLMELLAGRVGASIGGDPAGSVAGISAASETNFTEVIEVNANGKTLIGLLSQAVTNAPTAGEGLTGYTRYQCGDLTDFDPQKWPFANGQHGSLGTPVGAQGTIDADYWPTRFDLNEDNIDIDVSQKVSVVLSNAADGVAAAKWR